MEVGKGDEDELVEGVAAEGAVGRDGLEPEGDGVCSPVCLDRDGLDEAETVGVWGREGRGV